MKFGEILKKLRISKGVSLRKLADMINVSATYLSDVERGLRKPLSSDHLDKIAEILNLCGRERELLFDCAAKDRGEAVASDVVLYAGSVKSVSVALRKARELNFGDEEWLRIIEEMEKHKNG